MNPLSDVFGSMRIQEATYKRLEATAPWGFRFSGGMGPRVRFVLVVRGSALLRLKNQRRNISLSSGDLFIFILNDEPYTLTFDQIDSIRIFFFFCCLLYIHHPYLLYYINFLIRQTNF